MFVVDGDYGRRRSLVALLAARADLRVVGNHVGCDGVLDDVVTALPHVVAIGAQVLSARTTRLIADLTTLLPATRCVRLPPVSPFEVHSPFLPHRARLEDNLISFLGRVLDAAEMPKDNAADAVRTHLDRLFPTSARHGSVDLAELF